MFSKCTYNFGWCLNELHKNSTSTNRKGIVSFGMNKTHLITGSATPYSPARKPYALLLELAEGGEVFDRICEGPYSEADAATVELRCFWERASPSLDSLSSLLSHAMTC